MKVGEKIMTTQEMATEIVKSWLSQRGSISGSVVEIEIKNVYLATVQAILDSYELKGKND